MAACKYRPLINKAFYEEIKSKLTKEEGITIFKTEDEKEVFFDEYYFTYNSKLYKYQDTQMSILLKNKQKLLSNEISLVLSVYFEDNEISIPLDGDLISEIKCKKLKIINEEDLQYLLDNTALVSNKLLRLASLQNSHCIPLSFAKNKEEKKLKRKANMKLIIINAILIILMLGVYSLIIWLGETENGLKISQAVTFNLGFQILYSVIILFLAFFKSEKIKKLGKIILILYLVVYWLGLLFLQYRTIILLNIIFFVSFMAIGIGLHDKKTIKNSPVNRLIGFSIFLFLMLFYNTMDYEIIRLSNISAISGIISGVITVISIFFALNYYKKSKKDGEVKKHNLIKNLILITFGVFTFSFLYFMLEYKI